MKIKNQKPKIKTLYFGVVTTALFSVFCLLSCGKKEPIGYETLKPREGEIKIARGKIIPPYPTYSEFASTKGATYLFAGKEAEFAAIAIIYFEFDTLVTPESLWVVGKDSGTVYVCRALDSIIDMDSVNWSSKPGFAAIDSFEIKEGDTSFVCISALGSDTIFYIGVAKPPWQTGMTSFKSPHITIKEDTFFHTPRKSIYIDTSYFSPAFSRDSFPYIETGAFVTRCTLYLDISVLDSLSADSSDSFWTPITQLTDSLRKAYSLDSATVNKASLQVLVNEAHSYRKNIDIFAQYEVEGEKIFSPLYKVEEDTITLNLKPIIEKWFKKGEKLWIVLEGKTQEISRVALNLRLANLFIVYTLPPKGRE